MKDLLIIIVDDQESLRSCQEDVCQDLYPAADVITFSSAIGALDRIPLYVERYQHIVVITDYDMPEMSGVEFIVQLRTKGYYFPVVMVSACNQIQRDAASLEVPFLEKPFGEVELELILNTALKV